MAHSTSGAPPWGAPALRRLNLWFKHFFADVLVGILADRIQGHRPTEQHVAASIENLKCAFAGIAGVWRIYIFGSCADRTYHARSDIDAAVIFNSRSDYMAQRRSILRAKVETFLPWEPVLMIRDDFEQKRNTGGLAFEIAHRGTLIHDQGTEL